MGVRLYASAGSTQPLVMGHARSLVNERPSTCGAIGSLRRLYSLAWTVLSTGAGAVIAKKIVTAKFVQGRPLVFTMFFLIAFLFATNAREKAR